MRNHEQSAVGSDIPPQYSAEMLDPCPLAAQLWREQMVKEAAYFRFLQRGCGPGRAMEDWTAAEHDVDALMFMPTG